MFRNVVASLVFSAILCAPAIASAAEALTRAERTAITERLAAVSAEIKLLRGKVGRIQSRVTNPNSRDSFYDYVPIGYRTLVLTEGNSLAGRGPYLPSALRPANKTGRVIRFEAQIRALAVEQAELRERLKS